MNCIINLIAFIGVVMASKSKLQWNIEAPYRYNGFIYTDSKVVVINPALQIRITNNEEICNFYVNKSDTVDGKAPLFRAVVKSAYLGLGELELTSNTSLEEWRDRELRLSIMAEACHDPNSWSEPAVVAIKVLDPPGPLWTKKSYSVTINDKAPVGTAVIKVTAYIPRWTNTENKICKYSLRPPGKSPFQIDGEGSIRMTEILSSAEIKYLTLTVVAEDCSQPIHRESQVSVFVTVNPSCKFGWTGFHAELNYKPGSGIKYLGQNPRFQLCDYKENEDTFETLETVIKDCKRNKTLRLTTSVELKSPSLKSTEIESSHQKNCKLDFESLKLQREVCGIPKSNAVELLTELNRQSTGVLLFPIQVNIFPAASIPADDKFSFFFWMKREAVIGDTEEYVLCQIDETGNNIFSVSFKKCILQIRLKSYKSEFTSKDEEQSVPTMWAFTLPQLCNDKWHHIVVHASRASESPPYHDLSVFIDGEMVENKNDNPEVSLNNLVQPPLSNMTDIFLGQCPKAEETEFKGLLAGVVITPGIVLKSSTSRCLTKCSERLYFNGMNQMNPGMSVSLNSEMQMIIINGHSIDEVIRLVKVIGFVNPNWNPNVGERELTIETELSCGTKVYNVPTVRILVKVERQRLTDAYKNSLNLINLISTVTRILIPDSAETNSDTGVGVAVFANTTLEIARIPQSTSSRTYDASSTVSKCVVRMHPKLKLREYLDWPRHLLEAVSSEKYSIKVTNNSRTVLLSGLHNQQVYQFIIQHMRYFSSTTDDSPNQASRVFRLQCFADVDKNVVKSNVAAVKVTIWYNNYKDPLETTSAIPERGDRTTEHSVKWEQLMENISAIRNEVPLHARSNAALISEVEPSPRKTNNILFNILLGFGMFTLVFVLILLVRKSRKNRSRKGYFVPFGVVDKIWNPFKFIKERIRPSPSVRVELSRDFINCTSERRRDISMEMQWDDTELKTPSGCNVISNPMYENSVADIDDISVNKDVPPSCEEDESTSDDDTYGDFTDAYFEKGIIRDKENLK